jgi:hypothetical protein
VEGSPVAPAGVSNLVQWAGLVLGLAGNEEGSHGHYKVVILLVVFKGKVPDKVHLSGSYAHYALVQCLACIMRTSWHGRLSGTSHLIVPDTRHNQVPSLPSVAPLNF